VRAAPAFAPALIAGAVVACGGSPPPPPPAPVRVVAEQQDNAPTVPATDDDDDADAGDGVAVTAARGHMEPSAIAAGLAPLQDQLTACYTERVGRRRWLGGHVSLHWDVRASGEVAGVAVAESDLGAWPVEHCLLAVARGATFDKPVGGDADFAVPLEFSAKGKLVIWDDDKALRAVGGQLGELDRCAVVPAPASPPPPPHRSHARPRKRKPVAPPPGAVMPDNVTVTVYVGANGRAQSVGFGAPAALPDEWSACAEQVALAWRLPDPRSAVAKLAIRYRAR